MPKIELALIKSIIHGTGLVVSYDVGGLDGEKRETNTA